MEEREYTTGPGGAAYRTAAIADRRRISWGAIFAGTVAALSVQVLLTLLGLSIGLWVVDPATADQSTMQGVGIGAALWALITFIIALYCGGWIAGRMSGLGNRFDGLLEGFMVWGLVTVITFMLLTTAVGGIVGGAAGLAGDALTMAGQQTEDPEQAVEEFAAPAREAAEDPQKQQEVEQKARDVGEDVAEAGAATSFWAFLALLLGAIAAAVAGRQGSASGLREVVGEPDRPRRT